MSRRPRPSPSSHSSQFGQIQSLEVSRPRALKSPVPMRGVGDCVAADGDEGEGKKRVALGRNWKVQVVLAKNSIALCMQVPLHSRVTLSRSRWPPPHPNSYDQFIKCKVFPFTLKAFDPRKLCSVFAFHPISTRKPPNTKHTHPFVYFAFSIFFYLIFVNQLSLSRPHDCP